MRNWLAREGSGALKPCEKCYPWAVRLVFTDFLRCLEKSIDPGRFVEVWTTLGGVLRHELKRRGLWGSTPAYLGVYGWPSWEGTPGRGSLDDGPLGELTAECYAFIFVDRLAALQAQLTAKPNVEGLVLLNVRHFLHERQREHDPIGYRVFEILQTAVREGIAAGELFVLAGDPGVRNDTIVGFDPAAEPEPAEDLAPTVASWNDRLLPEMLTARGRHQAEVVARLRSALRELDHVGISSFRFRDIIDPLKNDTRMRWAALMDEAGGEREGLRDKPGAERLRQPAIQPESVIESRDSFAALARRVSAAIEREETDARTRRYLAALWRYLRIQAQEGDGGGPEEWAALDEEWAQLSHRRLAQLLDIPRERLPELFVSLRRLVKQCRAEAPIGKIHPAPREPGEERKPRPSTERDRFEPSGMGGTP